MCSYPANYEGTAKSPFFKNPYEKVGFYRYPVQGSLKVPDHKHTIEIMKKLG